VCAERKFACANRHTTPHNQTIIMAELLGKGVEVKWMVDDVNVWWLCVVQRFTDKYDAKKRPIFAVLYQGRPDLEMPDAEVREVVFATQTLLVDQEEGEVMQWRREGDSCEPPELLSPGCRVHVFDDKNEKILGTVYNVNDQGCYEVKCDNGFIDYNVSSDRIFEIESDEERDSPDKFVELVAQLVMRDRRFQSISAHQREMAIRHIVDLQSALKTKLFAYGGLLLSRSLSLFHSLRYPNFFLLTNPPWSFFLFHTDKLTRSEQKTLKDAISELQHLLTRK
jgi:hypothetical protein